MAKLGKEKLLFAAREGLRSVRGRVSLAPPETSIEPVLLAGAMALLEQVRGDILLAGGWSQWLTVLVDCLAIVGRGKARARSIQGGCGVAGWVVILLAADLP